MMRYVCDLKQFSRDYWVHEYDLFWEHGVGAFAWLVEEGRRVMLVILPESCMPRGFAASWLYMESEPNNWARPGDSEHWDGNVDVPTLSPSILVPAHETRDGGHCPGWHGFIKQGKVYEA